MLKFRYFAGKSMLRGHQGALRLSHSTTIHMLKMLRWSQRDPEHPWQVSQPLGFPDEPWKWTALQGSHRLKGSPVLRCVSRQRWSLLHLNPAGSALVSISDLRGYRVTLKRPSILITQPWDTGGNISTDALVWLAGGLAILKSILLE